MPKVVLIEPKIPPNTGNIARTCAATNTELHLVGPLGFEISDRYLKRAGLDYWQYVNFNYHQNIADFKKKHQERGGRLIGFSVRGKYHYVKWKFEKEDWLLFGSETEGLPSDLLNQCDATVYIPITQPKVRSLNLSVSVAVGLFEAYKQIDLL